MLVHGMAGHPLDLEPKPQTGGRAVRGAGSLRAPGPPGQSWAISVSAQGEIGNRAVRSNGGRKDDGAVPAAETPNATRRDRIAPSSDTSTRTAGWGATTETHSA
jgi:hypothetical protein